MDLLSSKSYSESAKLYCLNCGKELVKGQHKFCSSSCAATFNNKGRKHSNETRLKISASLKERYPKRNIEDKICECCGEPFTPQISPNGRISRSKTCSKECSKILKSKKISEKAKERVKNGEHQGWQSRNITSYPEKFWTCVLENNGINFIKEDFSTKKYFLDFLIEKNNLKIDLEIDGKQHLYADRKKHDEIRDNYLKSKGFQIYRIPWNEINSEEGKKIMKDKINNFIKYYNNI